jgi:hypothetical protein
LEQAAQRAVGAPDADELLKLVQQLLSEHGFAAAAMDHQMVRAYAAAAGAKGPRRPPRIAALRPPPCP